MKIYKYKLEDSGYGVAEVLMPIKRQPLSVGEQNGELFVWAKVDTEDEYSMNAIFHIMPTGYEEIYKDGLEFIGMVQMQNGLVWHVFWDKNWE